MFALPRKNSNVVIIWKDFSFKGSLTNDLIGGSFITGDLQGKAYVFMAFLYYY